MLVISSSYWFVWFEQEEDLSKAIAEANGSFWHGRRLAVQLRTNRTPTSSGSASRTPTRTLYIGNIPYETTDAELNEFFHNVDTVKDVRVAVDRTTGWPRGFAHAEFYDVDSCTKALEALNGQSLGGRLLRFDYAADAKSRGERRPTDQLSEEP